MSLNFLLGYTGVLSFGHAAYFGLGAYGAGDDRSVIWCRARASAIAVGVVVGAVAGAIIGAADRPAARRLFRHGDDRLRPGLLFHRLPLERGDRRRRRADRLARACLCISASPPSTSCTTTRPSIISCSSIFAVASAIMAWLLRSPFGRTLIAIRENERRARFLGIPVDQHIWISFVISCPSPASPARSMRCSTTSSIRVRCAWTHPAIS